MSTADENGWYYSDGDRADGPHTSDDIESLILTERIGAETLIWCKGMQDWAPVVQLARFSGIFDVPPPLPLENSQVVHPVNAIDELGAEIERRRVEEANRGLVDASALTSVARALGEESANRRKTPTGGDVSARTVYDTSAGVFKRHANRTDSSNFVVKHWRGQYSLPVSYWLVNILTNGATLAFVAIVGAAFTAERGYEPTLLFLGTSALWIGLAVALIWQLVGTWRSAERYISDRRIQRRGTIWGRVAQVMLVLAAFQNFGTFATSARPQIVEMYRIAFLDDPDIPENKITVADGGNRIHLEGGIKYGLAREVATILRATPQATVLSLSSPGGRIAESHKISDLVRSRGLSTLVMAGTECSSACTLVFLGGTRREAAAGSALGFHGSFFPGMSKEQLDDANKEFSLLYQRAGVGAAFVRRAMDVSPHDMWYPTADDLLGAGVITGVVGLAPSTQPSDQLAQALSDWVQLPPLDEIERTMRAASGVIDALQVVEPETAARIYAEAQKNWLELSAGGTGSFNEVARPILLEAAARHYSRADDTVLVALASVTADQQESLLAIDPGLCVGLLTSGSRNVEAARRLPPELLARELVVTEAALRTSAARKVATEARIDAIYSDLALKLAEILSSRQFELLSLDPEVVSAEDFGDYCTASIQFYRQVAELAPSAAGDLLRWSIGG